MLRRRNNPPAEKLIRQAAGPKFDQIAGLAGFQ
jgi:hypothetical protein